jgi:DNA-binding CsgD family transcriptional regulator
MADDEVGLVAGFYEAAFDAARFPDILQQLGEFAHGVSAGLLLWDRRTDQPALLATSGPSGAAVAEAYSRRYARLDPYRPLLETMPPNLWTASTEFFDDSYVAKSAFYNEYLASRGIRYMASARVVAGTEFSAFLGVHRGPGATPFSPDELRRLEQIGRHLARAVQLYLDVTRGRLEHEAAVAVLEALATAALLVDATGRVLFVNAAAEALLGAAGQIAIRQGRLTVGRTVDERRLERLVGAATGAATRGRIGGEMLIRRPTDQPPITVLVTPVGPMTTLYSLAPVPTALVLLHDPTRHAPDSTPRLRAVFGLTKAEAALARGLINGMRLTEIAARRSVSIETVRTQLRALFKKTGVSRQADLMRVLLAAPELPGPR